MFSLCLTVSWDGGVLVVMGSSSFCCYRNNTTIKYQLVAAVLFWDCSTGFRKGQTEGEAFGFMKTRHGSNVQVLSICDLLPVLCHVHMFFVDKNNFLPF